MNFGRLSALCDEILAHERQLVKAPRSGLRLQLRLFSPLIVCYVIHMPHNALYWKKHLQALDVALNSDTLSEEIVTGIFLSVMAAGLKDPAKALNRLRMKNHVSLQIEKLTTFESVLNATTPKGREIIATIEGDANGYNTNTFQNQLAVSLQEGVPETAFITVMAQIILIAAKAITSHDSCIETARRRMKDMEGKHPVDLKWSLTNAASDIVAGIIRRQQVVRHSIVTLVIACEQSGSTTSDLATVVSHADSFLKMAGLTGYKLVCEYVVEARAPILAMNAYHYEVNKFFALMELYKKHGSDAPYIKFLGLPIEWEFNPGGFEALYAFALGYASVQTPSMQQYTTRDQVRKHFCYSWGMKYASEGAGASRGRLVKNLDSMPTKSKDRKKFK